MEWNVRGIESEMKKMRRKVEYVEQKEWNENSEKWNEKWEKKWNEKWGKKIKVKRRTRKWNEVMYKETENQSVN